MTTTRTTGAALAVAAALLFSTAAVNTASAEEAKVHCTGVNGCKGQSACKTATNACKGQNSCKGTGFLEMTDEECKAAQAAAKKDAM
jgi:hypothetical protein